MWADIVKGLLLNQGQRWRDSLEILQPQQGGQEFLDEYNLITTDERTKILYDGTTISK